MGRHGTTGQVIKVVVRCGKTDGTCSGSVCYRNGLIVTKSVIKVYLLLNVAKKHKPETRAYVRPKPKFRVCQYERVSPGSGFFETRVGIPSSHDGALYKSSTFTFLVTPSICSISL